MAQRLREEAGGSHQEVALADSRWEPLVGEVRRAERAERLELDLEAHLELRLELLRDLGPRRRVGVPRGRGRARAAEAERPLGERGRRARSRGSGVVVSAAAFGATKIEPLTANATSHQSLRGDAMG